jgi:hypothetical protein
MAGHRIASLLKASPEGEGFHPSQTETLKKATEKTEQGSRANEGVAGGFAIPMG